MLNKLFWHWLKWPVVTITSGYLMYYSHDRIERFVNSVKFYTAGVEYGFVDKEQAFRLKLQFEKNGKNNLESYILNYSDKIPVYMRKNGLMFGSAHYNFLNFRARERALLCSGTIPEATYTKIKKEERRPLEEIFNGVYKLIGD